MTEEEKLFYQAFQKIKFTEYDSDCFAAAQAKRKMLLLNFYGSIYLNEKKEITEYVLYDSLKDYGKFVDNNEPGSVNNYADYVLAELSTFENYDRKNWKSSLDDFNIKDYICDLPCSNDINCKNSNFSNPDSFKDLKKAFQLKEENNKAGPSNVLFKAENQFPAVQAQLDQGCHKIRVFENPSYESITTKSYQKSIKNKNMPHNEEAEEPEKQINFTSFRTARDELQIQNLKKFGQGNNQGSNERNYNYGTVKKSLGTRKNGVFAKFQPPVKSKENKNNLLNPVTNMEVDEIVDERLKNIDPAMIEMIKNEIMDCRSKITWDDIAGLHLAKSTIQEIVVWPMLRPDIFTGLRRPPKGILLFGPPGTGKTLIGKCIASQSNSTFFSISASSLTSKWVGDGEKMVRTLFAVAKVHQPSVIFIDEIDSLLSQRNDSEHECSRRIKTEFLVQLDGAGTGEEDRILIIGATNRPQELDEAARRRLVKRLYIPLPDENARKLIIQNLISTEKHCLSENDIENIAKLTKGYSGADVKNLCQEASLGPIRSIAPSMIQCINPHDVRPLNAGDFESALCRIKSSVSEKDLDIYVAWDKQYGCGPMSRSQ